MKENATAQKIGQGKETPKMQVVKAETPSTQPTEPTAEAKPTELKLPTIEEIKRKNEVLRRLTEKYDQIQDKRKRVENFAISYDHDTASVIVTDGRSEEFESNSPKTITKLIEFWKEEFDTALKLLEEEIRLNA